MPLEILPEYLVAGETISETVTLDDYTPADSWALSYRFGAPTPFAVEGVATDDNTGWTIAVTAAETLTWRRGVIVFDAIVTLSGVSVAVDRGIINVAPSPLVASQYAAALTAVEAAIASYGANSKRSFTIGDMSVTFRDLDDLLRLRAFYIREINRETNGGRPKIIRARFTL